MSLAILSGILLAFSLPTRFGDLSASLGELAWIGFVPVYLALFRAKRNGQPFQLGFLTGFFLYGISLYWIFNALYVHGQVSTLASLLTLSCLAALYALFSGGAFALASFLMKKGIPLSVAFLLAWLFQDWARNFFPFGGFSWSSLAYGQGGQSTLIQIADLTGPYGVTFLILLANVLFGEVVLFIRKRRKVPSQLAVVFVLCMGIAFAYGHYRKGEVLNHFDTPEKKLLLIQGNVPQEEKWVSDLAEILIEEHVDLSKEGEELYHPDLILWPEASYAAVVSLDNFSLGLVDSLKTPLLMGAVSYRGDIPEEWPPNEESKFRLLNSAFVIAPGGFVSGRYDKNHLVPWGEYIPLSRIFFFIEKIVPGFADFTPGIGFQLLEGGGIKMGVMICFEDLFPEIAGEFTGKGAELLVNLTNDAWYGRSSAVPQHLEFSRFRAVENRRYLARVTNTGVTAVIDPLGGVVAQAPLFEPATLSATVKLGGPTTFYTRFGDVFVYLLMLVGVVWLALVRKRYIHDLKS